jgi:hypothetical protein
VLSAFGALDELMQASTPGRSADFSDWAIDTLSAVITIVLMPRVQPALGAAFLRLSYSTQAISAKQADSNKGLPCAASPPIGQHNPRKQT